MRSATIDPLRALIALETVVFLLAVVADAMTDAFRLIPEISTTTQVASVYFAIAIFCGWLIFGLPHAPNRQYWRVSLAIAGIAVVRAFPSHSMLPLALLLILSARLVFAYGVRGVLVACLAEVVSVATDSIAARVIIHVPLGEVLIGDYVDCALFFLIFGLIGISWLYASRAAATAALAERMRIALDLHDSLGHGLTTLSVQLQNADRLQSSDPQRAASYLKHATDTAAGLLDDVRETVSILHDDAQVAREPFSLLLERLRAAYASTHDMQITWRVHLPAEPSGRTAMAIYRVLQEALTNIVRHANAAHVTVELQGSAGGIEMCVQDDGRGLTGERHEGHGLLSMQTRIQSVGGAFDLISKEGAGTRIRARIPLEATP